MTPTMKSFVADRNRPTASLAALKVQVGSSHKHTKHPSPPPPQHQISAPRVAAVTQQQQQPQLHDDQDAFNMYDDFADLDNAFGDTLQPPANAFNVRENKEEPWADFRHAYVDGDSYPDTTSGVLTEQQYAEHPQDTVAHPDSAFDPGTAWHNGNQVISFSRPIEPEVPAFAFGMRSAPAQRPASRGPHLNPLTAAPPNPFSHVQQTRNDNEGARDMPKPPFPDYMAPYLNPQEQSNHPPTMAQQLAQPVTQNIVQPLAQNMTQPANKPKRTVQPPLSPPTMQPATHSAGRSLQTDPQPHALDYERSALFKMKYSDLQEQSFDEDPAAKATTAPRLDDTVAQRLESAMTAISDKNGTTDMAMFEAMDNIEWEDAGEWISSELVKATADLTALRRRKRTFAKDMEAEVDQWYHDTKFKQKSTESELWDLRNRGSAMLNGVSSTDPSKT